MNVQDECIKIHSKFGMSEMANYKIQLLFDSEIEKVKKEYEEKLRWNSPNIKPKLSDKDSMFSVNVSIQVQSVDYEYSGYYNFHTQKWLIYPKEEPFEFQLIAGWRYFL